MKKKLCLLLILIIMPITVVKADGGFTLSDTEITVEVGQTKKVTVNSTNFVAKLLLEYDENDVAQITNYKIDADEGYPFVEVNSKDREVDSSIDIKGLKVGKISIKFIATETLASTYDLPPQKISDTKTLVVNVVEKTAPAEETDTKTSTDNTTTTDDNGSTTKSETSKETVENPKTGISDYIWILPIVFIISALAIKFSARFKKIKTL